MDARVTDWNMVERQVREFVQGETRWLPALSNVSALLAETLADVNWVGFYVADALLAPGGSATELVLGPFQGKVACVRIPWGRGVCGTAAERDQTLRVDNVHNFPGHIACDSASRSEIVVPLHADGRVIGVLDVDSPCLARFCEEDQRGLEACAAVLEALW